MSFYTELHIGLWNAWIGTAIALGAQTLFTMLKPEARKRLFNMSWYTSKDKIAAYLSMLLMYGMIIFSIWVPFKTGTAWFYTGLVIFLAGLISSLIALKNYADTPQDEAIVKGIYRISRNPLYFFYSVKMLGICIACASLPMFIFWIIYNIPTHLIIIGEERYCLETYGDSFKEYMKKVPRYFLFF
ncbi:MAG: hypothetical protein JW864_07205 [Spirochaetes bacterium]|nr:hypothetical protein [Spirochaetota bacterium]